MVDNEQEMEDYLKWCNDNNKSRIETIKDKYRKKTKADFRHDDIVKEYRDEAYNTERRKRFWVSTPGDSACVYKISTKGKLLYIGQTNGLLLRRQYYYNSIMSYKTQLDSMFKLLLDFNYTLDFEVIEEIKDKEKREQREKELIIEHQPILNSEYCTRSVSYYDFKDLLEYIEGGNVEIKVLEK